MTIIYWFLIICVFLAAIRRIRKKDYYNFAVIVAIGIFIPLCVYHLGWSRLIVKPIASEFYLTFIYLGIMVLLVSAGERKKYYSVKQDFQLRSEQIVLGYNLLYVLCSLAENYILSGRLLPMISSIDVHTRKVGGLMWISNTCFVVLAINYLAFHCTKKKSYIVWMAVSILLPMVGKGSRQDAVMSSVQLGLMIAFVNRESLKAAWERGKINANTIRKALLRIVLIVFVAVAAIAIVSVGVFRTSGSWSTESMYTMSIGYSGPGEGIVRQVLAWYYGYLSFSFNNFNNNILNTPIHENWLGLNSFKALWFGLLRLSWFGFSSDFANRAKTILTTSATTTTMFWDFYYDYGIACFLPIIISGVFYLVLKEGLCKGKTVGAYLRYFYWAGLWLFASFNNTVFFDCVFINMIIMSVVSHYAFHIGQVDGNY